MKTHTVPVKLTHGGENHGGELAFLFTEIKPLLHVNTCNSVFKKFTKSNDVFLTWTKVKPQSYCS